MYTTRKHVSIIKTQGEGNTLYYLVTDFRGDPLRKINGTSILVVHRSSLHIYRSDIFRHYFNVLNRYAEWPV